MKGPEIAQLVKSLDLHFRDCKFEPHCRRGAFLVWAFRKPLTPNYYLLQKITVKIMEVPTSGELGSRSLHGCPYSAFSYSLKAAEYSVVDK